MDICQNKEIKFSNMNTVIMATQPLSGLAPQKQSWPTTLFIHVFVHIFTRTALVYKFTHTKSICISGR